MTEAFFNQGSQAFYACLAGEDHKPCSLCPLQSAHEKISFWAACFEPPSVVINALKVGRLRTVVCLLGHDGLQTDHSLFIRVKVTGISQVDHQEKGTFPSVDAPRRMVPVAKKHRAPGSGPP